MEREIRLFPGAAPGSESVGLEEVVFEESWEPNHVKRIVTGVAVPTITPFLPEKPSGMAMLVIPGGGYRRQVLNLEGSEIAEWLNSLGIAAFVLKHRMPGDGHENGVDVPLQDAQRAVRIIRSRAQDFGIEPNLVGAMGFSAGGHLASALGTCSDMQVYPLVDDADSISSKPDFLVLGYPCISLKGWKQSPIGTMVDILRKYPTDELVSTDTPDSFIMVADDDEAAPAEHSLDFYLALRKAGVPAELHIYKHGQHGFGLGKERGAVQGWTEVCRAWLESVANR